MPAFVFPGQGSQFPGMGQELFDMFPELVNHADQILGYSLRDLCTEPGAPASDRRGTGGSGSSAIAVKAITAW